jgi:hypothetical protein
LLNSLDIVKLGSLKLIQSAAHDGP